MFTIQPIGYVRSPYKDAREIPRGLGAKHETDGVLEILPEFQAGLTDIEGFSTSWSFGYFIALKGSNCSAHRLAITGRTAYSRRGPRSARTPLALLSSSFPAAKACGCTSAESTCSMERRFSI